MIEVDLLHLENGFTRFSNDILEAIFQSKNFKPLEYKLMLCIIRFSYGFSKSDCVLKNKFLVQQLGISKSHVCDTIHLLESKNIISRNQDVFKINPNCLTWKQPTSLTLKTCSSTTEQKFPKQGTTVPQTRNNSIPQSHSASSDAAPLKKTIKKEVKTTSYRQEKYVKNRREAIPTNEEWNAYIKTQGENHV